MEALPNLGSQYVRRFRAIYPELAQRNHLDFVPFLLAGVGGVDSLNQADGIHPTARGTSHPRGKRVVGIGADNPLS